jgi:signal transduction histidine kinase
MLSLFSFTKTICQNQTIDSLKEQLAIAKEDTTKVNLFLLLSYSYTDAQQRDSAIWYAQKGLFLAQEIKYVNGELEALLRMSTAYWEAGSYPQALQLAIQNLQVAERTKDTMRILSAASAVGRTYFEMNEYLKALEYAQKVKQLVHSGYFKQEKEVKKFSNRYLLLMSISYLGLNRYDSALYYAQRSHEIALALNQLGYIYILALNFGNIYSRIGDYDSAFYYYRTSIRYAPNDKTDEFVPETYLGMAKLFQQKRQPDSAIYYSKLSLDINQHLKLPAEELKGTSLLNELYAQKNNIDSAYKYLVKTNTLKDSLYNQEKLRQVQNLQFNEILRLQQLEQERKEAKQRYETRAKVFSLVGGLVILLLIAFLLYRNNKHKQKTNVLLQYKNEEIQKTLQELKSTQSQLIQSEKMASLGELTAGIAHEIQNPLNFVNNFSDVNTELIDELDQEADKGNLVEVKSIAKDIKDNEQKINHHGKRADAIVKGMLQHSRTSSGQKEPTDINALADEYLRLAYHGLKAKDRSFNATMKTDFDESIGNINIVPHDIGRVVLNLINNAFYVVDEKKKQFGDGYEPTVSVSTKRDKDKVEIKVKDNGNGIPQKVLDKIFQPFFTTKPTGQGTGLGLSLSYDIVKSHGGEIIVETKEGEGTDFFIKLPT